MKRVVQFILILLLININAQSFADKKYYLIDSLDLNQISDEDRNTVAVGLADFHESINDASKVKAIMFIVEQSLEGKVWNKYNNWAYAFIQERLSRENDKLVNENLKIRLGEVLNNKGYFAQYNLGDIEGALAYYEESLTIFKGVKAESSIAGVLNNLAYVYNEQGDIKKSLSYYHKSLKLLEKVGNKRDLAKSLNNLGDIYQGQGDFEKGLALNNKALTIQKEIGDTSGMAITLNNIGMSFKHKGDLDCALEYFFKVKATLTNLSDQRRISVLLNNIGDVYEKQGRTKAALEYYYNSLAIKESIGNKSGESHSLFKIGNLLFNEHKLEKAESCVSKSLSMSKELGYPKKIQQSALLLSQIYEEQGLAIKALTMYKLSIKMKDSLKNESTLKAVIEQQLHYTYEKKAAADSITAAESAKVKDALLVAEKAENKSKSVLNIAIGIGLVLVILFAYIIIRGYRVKQDVLKHKIEIEVHKSNGVKKDLEQKEKELALKLQMITEKVGVIESLKKQLINTSTDDEHINKLISSLEQNYVSDKSWDNIIHLFSLVHKGFIVNLKSRNSNITRSDIRISILMKLNYSNSGMAETLNISLEGVKKAKQRLKKKIAQNAMC